MSYTEPVENAAVAAMIAMGTWISLHTSDPSNTGAGEDITVPRQQTTWGTPASGVAVGSQVTHAAKGGVHYTYYGVWTSGTSGGGTFRWGYPLDPGFTLDTDGNAFGVPRVAFPA
jgi:hypothetical protein